MKLEILYFGGCPRYKTAEEVLQVFCDGVGGSIQGKTMRLMPDVLRECVAVASAWAPYSSRPIYCEGAYFA